MARALTRGGAEGEDWRIDIMLDEIGVEAATAERPYGALSGGWQRLVLVASAALLEDPDILVLDEPTNHLDLGNIATLERWLTEVMKLPMLIVSARPGRSSTASPTARMFLRADSAHSVQRPHSPSRANRCPGARCRPDARPRSLEEKEIKRLEETCARYKVWAQKNDDVRQEGARSWSGRSSGWKAAKTKIYVARERRLELGESEMEAKVALRVEGYVTVRTPDERALFTIERLAVRAGDRIAHARNQRAAGKSTLLTALALEFAAKDAPHYDGKAAGAVQSGLARLAVFDQAMADLPMDASLIEYMSQVQGVGEREAIQALIKAGLPAPADGTGRSLRCSRFGERARLKFLRLKAEQPNFYLLDEPAPATSISRAKEDAGKPIGRGRCLLPVRLARPLLHDARRRHASWYSPRQAGRGRRPGRVLRRPGLKPGRGLQPSPWRSRVMRGSGRVPWVRSG